MSYARPKRRLIHEFKIGAHRLPAWEVDGLLQSTGSEAVFTGTEIQVDAHYQGADRWQRLIHELVHAAAYFTGQRWDTEPACDTIGTILAQALAPFLGPPPEAKPLEPLTDDDDTPAVTIKPVRPGPKPRR